MAKKAASNRSGTAATGAQTVGRGVPADGALRPIVKLDYKTIRMMRKHPSIAIARACVIAPVASATWAVESRPGTPPERANLIRQSVVPRRIDIVEVAMRARVDYGWQPFELVWAIDDADQFVLDKAKALLQDISTILINANGAYDGIRQKDATGQNVDLPPEDTLTISYEVEGTNWYGENLLDGIGPYWTMYREVDKLGSRYNRKVAGANWVVSHPTGSSYYGDSKVLTPNHVIAKDILNLLESCGGVSVPQTLLDKVEQVNQGLVGRGGWDIRLLGDEGTRITTFIEERKYYDSLFCRGLLVPERSVLEGQFGTKAEAGVHADLSLMFRQLDHEHITRAVNKYVVDRMLRENFGDAAAGSVWLKAVPLADEAKQLYHDLYMKILENPAAAVVELTGAVNRRALREALGVPTDPRYVDPSAISTIEVTPEELAAADPVRTVTAAVESAFADALSGK